jgi:hypothetical protein
VDSQWVRSEMEFTAMIWMIFFANHKAAVSNDHLTKNISRVIL